MVARPSSKTSSSASSRSRRSANRPTLGCSSRSSGKSGPKVVVAGHTWVLGAYAEQEIRVFQALCRFFPAHPASSTNGAGLHRLFAGPGAATRFLPGAIFGQAGSFILRQRCKNLQQAGHFGNSANGGFPACGQCLR